jgi:hypothetical protein
MRVSSVVSMILLLCIFIVPIPAINGADRVVAGNAAEGRALFTSLRCDSCHSVWGSGTGAEHPLPDLSAAPPVAIAARITQRARLAPEMLFDEMTMSFQVSNATEKELGHLATYLNAPSTAPRK